jgi:hypothetical protein
VVVGHQSHVVGVSARHRLVFDHEDPKSLAFNCSGFYAACGGARTFAVLGEMKMVGLRTKNRFGTLITMCKTSHPFSCPWWCYE